LHDTDIHLIAHSMGNGPLMEVLADLREEFDKPFRQIVLAAPDIDRDLFISLAEQMKGVADGVTLYASSSDWAIWASKFWAGGIPRAGDVPEEHPIVLPDVIETIDASAISTSILSLHHSGYAEASRLLDDIGLLWRSGAPPPERTPTLRPMPSREAPEYWRFPENPQ
jgi:esterase/lipase superfamily enzyme